MKKLALINHGCAKNLVDSELMLGLLSEKGYAITLDETEADVVVINTCSFIHDAEKESVQSILKMVDDGKKVIVTGCLPQKYKDELKEAIPEVVAMLGTTDFSQIVDVIENLENKDYKYTSKISAKPKYIYPENIERQQITVGSSSYIKIADGCNYHCGYCIIPQLRGAYQSRTIENIVKEATAIAKKGCTEIVLIAQDTTSYGIDLYGKQMLPELLEKLNEIEELSWIRIMYGYPSQITDELIDAMARLDKVVKYLDIPLQHSHPDILNAMRRPAFDYEELINKLRARIPNITIRSAFIVGYPSETEEHFKHLYKFIEKMKLDKVGVFKYSREKNTISYAMKEQISAKVKKQRHDKLMKLQQKISAEVNQKYIGQTLPCLIEGITDNGLIIARSEHDAPEIDGVVYIDSKKDVIPGDIENVLITKADAYDLYGTIQE